MISILIIQWARHEQRQYFQTILIILYSIKDKTTDDLINF